MTVMTSNFDDRAILAAGLNRRSFIKAGASAAALAAVSGALSRVAYAADGFIALVHTQAAGDQSAVDSMIAKINQLAQEKGLQARVVYAQDPATYETIFRTLADAGASVIVSTFNEVGEPFKALAPSYPKTKWIQLFGDAIEPPLPNVVTVSYDYYLGCYLSGVFAARMTKSGKIGYIGGISIPPLNADFNALKAGAHSVNPELTVTAAFAGSFQDPAKGQEIATQMFNDGIDYIQTDSAATDGGIIAAANEGAGRMLSTLARAQYPLGPKSIVGIVSLDFGQSLYIEVGKALGAEWAGGKHVATGLGTGVVEFELSPLYAEQGPADRVAKSKEIWAEIEKTKAGILDGSIVVPFNTTL